ncbi:hypothetical protein Vretimale_14823 [Volvox reticuliferus]|nr:hypothetical protein Vretimale_14823 [Volvox reticuliferus]
MASSLFRYCRNPSYSLLNAGNFGARLLAFSTSIQDDPGGDATKKAALNDLLLASYRQLLERGVLLPDATQATAVHALQTLQNAVLHGEKLRSSFSEEGSANTEFSPCRPDGNGSGDSSSSSSSSSSSRRNGFGVSSNANGRQIGNNKLPIPAAAAGGGEPPAVHIAPKPHTVRGAYLWGPVGSGKTALMDLFASTTRQCLEAAAAATAAHTAQLGAASARVTAAAATAAHGTSLLLRSAGRQHYHEFMQSVHGRLHELHQALPRVVARNRQGRMVYRYAEPEEDPLVTVARELGSRTAVLCLDELHVTDVADAMILSRPLQGRPEPKVLRTVRTARLRADGGTEGGGGRGLSADGRDGDGDDAERGTGRGGNKCGGNGCRTGWERLQYDTYRGKRSRGVRVPEGERRPLVLWISSIAAATQPMAAARGGGGGGSAIHQ